MNAKAGLLVGLVFLLLGGFVAYTWMSGSTSGRGGNDVERYTNREFGISLEYPREYQLDEREVGGGQRSHHVITLIRESDLPIPKDSEGPPVISVDIYQNNLDRLTLMQWLKDTNFSNFKQGDGRYASTTVSSTEAVFFRWSGLYEGNTVAFVHKGSIIAVSGQYLSLGDAIVTDFERVVDSIQLE